MLSSGKYHLQVPQDLESNIRFRADVLRRAEKSRDFQLGLIEMCRQDILFWISTFVWQFNPLKKGSEAGPFIPWECQKRALLKDHNVYWPGEMDSEISDAGILWCIENDKSLRIGKSRDMGASWFCLLALDWLYLFRRWQKFLCISRSEKAVENNSPDSLFWKLDWVHSHLPEWMLPSGGVRRRKQFFGNDDLGSSITGEASTGLAGVGGRATAMLIDEFAMIREDAEVRQFTASTTNSRIFNSTDRGMDTEFYRLSMQPEIMKLNIHWTQHPDKIRGLYRSAPQTEILDKTYVFQDKFIFVKDGKPLGGPRPGIRSPWYDEKCAEIGSERAVAMDLDMNAAGAVSQFFDPMILSNLEAKYCAQPFWTGRLEFDPETFRPKKLIEDSAGIIRMWIMPDAWGKVPPGKYGAGADLSTGSGKSNTCLSIANALTGEKVLEIADPLLAPTEAAELFAAVCWLFENESGQGAKICWEIQGPGGYFKKRLCDEIKYPNVYYYVDDFGTNQTQTDKPGFNPTPRLKRILLEEYYASLKRHEFVNRSKPAIRECMSWRYDDAGNVEYGGMSEDDPSGAKENHGDRVIADSLANKMIKLLGKPSVKQEKQEPAVLSPQWRYDRFEKMRRSDEMEV